MVRPIDDVCPWDVPSGPSIEHALDATGTQHLALFGTTLSVESQQEENDNNLVGQSESIKIAQTSRKNSTQLDSYNSSSDVSLSVTEVSEHLRKSCSLQNSGNTAGTTTTSERIGSGSDVLIRNYSMGSTSGRVKLVDIGRPSASSCNYPSTQHSFEYFNLITDNSDASTKEKFVTKDPESNITRSTILSFERQLTTKTSPKTPIISISTIVGDLASDSSTIEPTGKTDDDYTARVTEEIIDIAVKNQDSESDKKDPISTMETDVAIPAQAEAETKELSENAQVVPVWEPDTQQDGQTASAIQPASQQQRDNNVNEVCPWEDEENCRVDAPYVKTYATLGYL